MKAQALVLAVTVSLVLALGTSTDRGQEQPVSHLEVFVPGSVPAGDAIELEIRSDPGAEVVVVFSDGYATSAMTVTLEAPSIRVTGPTARRAGRWDVIAGAGDLFATGATEVVPGPVVGATLPLVGARSIVADGIDQAMVVAIPSDDFGNPAPPGTPVDISAQHPDGSVVRESVVVERTLAWTWVRSVTTAGTAQITAYAGGAPGGQTLSEVPDSPRPFALVVETELRPADGVSHVVVASDLLADRHGNRILDGTAALLRARYPDGSLSVQTAVTVGGVARAVLEAPGEPGFVRVEMVVQGVTSRPLDIGFIPALVTAATAATPARADAAEPSEVAR